MDEALARWPQIIDFLGQDVAEAAGLADSRQALDALLRPQQGATP